MATKLPSNVKGRSAAGAERRARRLVLVHMKPVARNVGFLKDIQVMEGGFGIADTGAKAGHPPPSVAAPFIVPRSSHSGRFSVAAMRLRSRSEPSAVMRLNG